MPSGSIPHGHERPDAANRHAQHATNFNLPADHVETLSEDELRSEMRHTLEDILTLTRRYMRLYWRWQKASGQTRPDITGPQFTIMWLANRAHWPGSLAEIERLHEQMEDETLI